MNLSTNTTVCAGLNADPMVPVLHTVTQVRRDTRDTFTMILRPTDGGSPAPFLPGQFNMVYAFGVGEVPISISGDPRSGQRLTHTIRAVGPVTRALRGVPVGGTLGVRGPFGSHWPLDELRGRDLLVVCGGIGLAPLRPVIYQVLHERQQYRRVTLLYGARTADEILYRRELTRWSSRLDVDVLITVDRASGSWHGNVGVVTNLISRAALDPATAVALVCGPEIMMRYAVMGLQQRGLDTRNIYVSMERNMKCGLGWCGHCQYGGSFVCTDGPVFRFDRIASRFEVREL